MEDLTETELHELEDLLLAAKRDMEEHLRAARSAEPASLEAAPGLSSAGAGAGAAQAQQVGRAQRGRDEATAKLVNAALAKVRRGVYGVCASCEEPIGYERLRARPEGPLCLQCRQAMG